MKSRALLPWFEKPIIESCAEPVESRLRHNIISLTVFLLLTFRLCIFIPDGFVLWIPYLMQSPRTRTCKLQFAKFFATDFSEHADIPSSTSQSFPVPYVWHQRIQM